MSSDPHPSLKISLESFYDNLRRFFLADETPQEEVRRLFDYWESFAATPARVRGQEPLFRLENASPVFGLKWWEERQQGSTRTIHPITPFDRANMLISTDPRPGNKPKPRWYRPNSFVGLWRRIGVSDDGDTVQEPVEARAWHLQRDGILETEGDPDRAGFRWRVHLARNPELWLISAKELRPQIFVARIKHGDEMDLRPRGSTHAFSRWRCFEAP